MPTRATLVLNVELTGRSLWARSVARNAQDRLFRMPRSATIRRRITGEDAYGNALVGAGRVLCIPERLIR